MLLDLMINNMSYNVKLATLIGVENSIYIASLCEMLNRATKNNTLEDGYFLVDRAYITISTGIPSKTQNSLDTKLKDLNILDFNENKDKVKLNIQTIVDMICEEDQSKIKSIQSKSKVKTTNVKMTKRQVIFESLKSHVKDVIKVETPTGQQILDAYLGWVEGVFNNPKGFLSNRAIDIFISTIDNYAKGDLNVALELIDIATVAGYRDALWAINTYEDRKSKIPFFKTSNIQPNKPVFNNDETF